MFPASVANSLRESTWGTFPTRTAGGREIATILQNAETIRLTRASGEAVSIVTLQPGDEVLVALEETGRHFGHKIQETILEK